MESVIRAVVAYLFLMVVLRIAGKKTLGEITTFDFVLVLAIGEASQNILLGQDPSITNSAIVIITLVMLDHAFATVKRHWPRVNRAMESVPVVLVADGIALTDRMKHEQIDLQDVMAIARNKHGIVKLSQIRYAVLECGGDISIVPMATE
jgi:uncharacterized membrane protein YcaP (DUF421 family)